MIPVLILALAVAAPAPKDAPKKDPLYVGDWVAESITAAGQAIPAPPIVIRLSADGKFERTGPDGKLVIGGKFTVEMKQSPAHLDIFSTENQGPGRTSKGILKLDGDTLTICSAQDDTRPTGFTSPAGSSTVLMVLKRKKD
jgi:uncharacterized protein (TIGR03067 family)